VFGAEGGAEGGHDNGKHGPLDKQSNFRKKWQTRYFDITSHYLKYYESEKHWTARTKLLATIDLKVCTLYALTVHSLCTLYALSVHSLCTLYALSVHSLCTLYALSMHSLYTLYRPEGMHGAGSGRHLHPSAAAGEG
jgi:hypothetical protein